MSHSLLCKIIYIFRHDDKKAFKTKGKKEKQLLHVTHKLPKKVRKIASSAIFQKNLSRVKSRLFQKMIMHTFVKLYFFFFFFNFYYKFLLTKITKKVENYVEKKKKFFQNKHLCFLKITHMKPMKPLFFRQLFDKVTFHCQLSYIFHFSCQKKCNYNLIISSLHYVYTYSTLLLHCHTPFFGPFSENQGF